MFAHRSAILLLIVLLAGGLAGCGAVPPTFVTPTAVSPSTETIPTPVVSEGQPEPSTPEEVVAAFYQWYLSYNQVDPAANIRHNALADKAYRQSPYLAEGMKAKIDEIVASFTAGGYDPLLCAQDIPESFEVSQAEINGDKASLVVRTSFAGHWLAVDTVRSDGRWQIMAIGCQTAVTGAASGETEQAPATENPSPVPQDAAAVAGWLLYADPENGFQIQYPANWVLRPVDLGIPGEDRPLQRVTGLHPAEGADGMIPVSIEVYVGSEESFRAAFPGSGPEAAVEVAGIQALRSEPDPATGTEFTIFQHPVDDQTRVVFRYETNMAAGIEGLDGIVEQMLATFKFGRS